MLNSGAKDIDRVKKLLQSAAQLEFWTTGKNIEFFLHFYNEASNVVKDLVDEGKKLDEKKTTSEIDDLLVDVEVKADSLSMDKNPLWI